MRLETLAIHGGFDGDPTTRAASVPIYQTAAYIFDSADHAAALFDLEVEGFRYSRISNPTTDILEKRVAAMEGGIGALAVASGQAALHYAFVTLADHGGTIVATPQLYGTTHTLLAHVLPRQGIRVRFAKSDSAADIAAEIDETTRAVFCESVGNPAGNICDIAAIARVAHAAGVPLVVDNTVATPALLRPIEHGADIVVHSLTKFMGGHGTTLGGIIIDGGRFDWRQQPARFSIFNEPDLSYHGLVYAERFGAAAYIARARSVWMRTTGAILPATSAFQLMQGIETLSLRMERHVANAGAVARFLRDDRRVAWVNYAGFPDHPGYALVQSQLGGKAPSLLTFGIAGSMEDGKVFFDALKLVRRLVNIGDAKTLACHPASTTHRQMTPEDQVKAGIHPETIRISVGIEHIDDIIADLDQALGAALTQRPPLRLAAGG
ncbi:MAG: O-acetylhomoserine aminocarboxypropyltransferase/cysteine synthase [Hyphomicrobiales bacterium]|nr:O-acetylhomoserine aminocarboxypropyltransferase/cysteine synthase [Hyphomicrobiales bacterium]